MSDEVWKVLDESLASPFKRGALRLQYRVGERTDPAPGTRIFAFRTLADALAWRDTIREYVQSPPALTIHSCLAGDLQDVPLAPIAMSLAEAQAFWKWQDEGGDERHLPRLDPTAAGTVSVSWLELVAEVLA